MVWLILGLMLGSLYAIVYGAVNLTVPLPPMSLVTFDAPAFLLGVATSLFKSNRINQYVHVMVGTGIMGGLSTFSSFVFGAVEMMQDPSSVFVSICYLVISLVIGFAAVELGLIAGAKVTPLPASDTPQ